MKKLKIFLLLSILLCFGFALSSEVHASGPKVFEVGDVLPATTQLKIDIKLYDYFELHSVDAYGVNINFILLDEVHWEWEIYIEFDGVIVCYEQEIDSYEDYHIVDTSNWSLRQRTIKSVSSENGNFVTWEDLNPTPTSYSITFEENGGTEQTDLSDVTALPDPLPIPTKENHTFVGWYYDDEFFNEAHVGDPLTSDVTLYARWLPGKLFEEDDVLPATTQLKIRILFGPGDYFVETVDRSGIYIRIDWIGGVEDQLDLHVEIDGYVQYLGEVTSVEISYTIDTSNWSLGQRTIKSVSSENGSFVTWEDTTPDGYTQGYLTAREEYGYYDSITNQWLSVEEYLELYGTDKPGQSDFYANFDKYFIPAMIIVFGGAIVLTVLKVFKGRE